LQHPVRLVLLGRDEADGVGVQALGRELLVQRGDEAVLVGFERLDLIDVCLTAAMTRFL